MTRRWWVMTLVMVALFTLSAFLQADSGTRLGTAQILQMLEPSIVISGPPLVLALLTSKVTWVRNWGTGTKRAFVILSSLVLAGLFLKGQGSLGADTVGQVLAAISGALAGIVNTTTVAVVKAEERTA